MPDIVARLECIESLVTATTLRQLSRIIAAVLSMTGRVTMLGISRWAGEGGSYRTVQRFFYTVVPWATLFWAFFRQHLYRPDDVYIMVGDEVVVSKAGHHTHGLDRFFAGVFGRVIPGLAFFSLALVNTKKRRSSQLRIEQVVPRQSLSRRPNRLSRASRAAPKAVRTKRQPKSPCRRNCFASKPCWKLNSNLWAN